jgi:hypothetical protein
MASSHSFDRISAEQAAAILHRAAELQVAELQRREDRSLRQLRESIGSEGGEEGGYAPDELRDAAVAAGISAEHVDRALTERAALGVGSPRSDGSRMLARRLIGPDPGWLEVSRRYAAPPSKVLDAMQRVFPSDRYRMALRDTVGTDPLAGAVLVFDVPSVVEQHGGAGTFAYELAWARVSRLLVTVAPDPGSGGCEVLIRTELSDAWSSSAATAVVLGSLGGAGGGLGGFALAGSVFALAGAAVALPVVAAAGLVGWSAVRGCRALYAHGIPRARRALEELLRIVDVHSRAPSGFNSPAAHPQRPVDDHLTTTLLGSL